MKALILAGGRGKRLNGANGKSNKCMIPINGKNAIEHSLECVLNTKIQDIVIVVGHLAESIINCYGNDYKGRRIRYVIQREQCGLVHAIECAREVIDGDDFLLLLGDEILLNPRHQLMIDRFKSRDIFAMCGILKVEDRSLISRTYTLIQDSNNTIFRLIEKPRHPLNDLMGTGDCVFKNEIYQYIDVTPIHHQRQEKELPDLIQCAIDDGKLVKSFFVCDKYANINSTDDIEFAESFFSSETLVTA